MPARLLEAAPRTVLPATGSECRVYERTDCELPSSCQPAAAWGSAESKWSATIRNISQGGISVDLRRRFERGTALAIELPGSGGRAPYTVLAKVVHIKGLPDGSWALGCKFVSDLNEDEICRLFLSEDLNDADASSSSIHVTSKKRSIDQVQCQLEVRPGTVVAYVIKRLSVAKSWPLAPGKIVTLRGGDGKDPWAVTAHVVHCRQQDQNWVLRCRLAKRPSAERLLQMLGKLDARS